MLILCFYDIYQYKSLRDEIKYIGYSNSNVSFRFLQSQLCMNREKGLGLLVTDHAVISTQQ